MHSRRAMAALISLGLVVAACGGNGSDGGETAAVDSVPDESQPEAAPAEADNTAPAETLVVAIDDGSTVADDNPETATPTTPTTAGPTSTAVSSPTTAAPTTVAPTSPPTTAAPTPAAGVETRPEILNLALPTYGGGTFDPNSVAGKNVVLWFWGAH